MIQTNQTREVVKNKREEGKYEGREKQRRGLNPRGNRVDHTHTNTHTRLQTDTADRFH